MVGTCRASSLLTQKARLRPFTNIFQHLNRLDNGQGYFQSQCGATLDNIKVTDFNFADDVAISSASVISSSGS